MAKKQMEKKQYVYVIRDDTNSPISVCNNKTTAIKQLQMLAEYVAWNRRTKISECQPCSNTIYFDNYDFVHFVEVPVLNTMKSFNRYFGFDKI